MFDVDGKFLTSLIAFVSLGYPPVSYNEIAFFGHEDYKIYNKHGH